MHGNIHIHIYLFLACKSEMCSCQEAPVTAAKTFPNPIFYSSEFKLLSGYVGLYYSICKDTKSTPSICSLASAPLRVTVGLQQMQKNHTLIQPISGRVDRASATEAVDMGSIPSRVKPKTIKIGIHSFPA